MSDEAIHAGKPVESTPPVIGDHYCGDHIAKNRRCSVCDGPDPR